MWMCSGQADKYIELNAMTAKVVLQTTCAALNADRHLTLYVYGPHILSALSYLLLILYDREREPVLHNDMPCRMSIHDAGGTKEIVA